MTPSRSLDNAVGSPAATAGETDSPGLSVTSLLLAACDQWIQLQCNPRIELRRIRATLHPAAEAAAITIRSRRCAACESRVEVYAAPRSAETEAIGLLQIAQQPSWSGDHPLAEPIDEDCWAAALPAAPTRWSREFPALARRLPASQLQSLAEAAAALPYRRAAAFTIDWSLAAATVRFAKRKLGRAEDSWAPARAA